MCSGAGLITNGNVILRFRKHITGNIRKEKMTSRTTFTATFIGIFEPMCEISLLLVNTREDKRNIWVTVGKLLS
jgi:hypothetical protein